MPPERRDRLALGAIRHAIDRLDAAAVALLALRRRLAAAAAARKRRGRLPLSDPAREAQVRRHLRGVGRDLALPPGSADALGVLLIGEARRVQGLDPGQGSAGTGARMLGHAMPPSFDSTDPSPARWLRLLPPPTRLAPLLRLAPERAQRQLLERALRRVLGEALAAGDLDFLRGRTLGIELSDVGLRWVVGFDGGALRALPRDTAVEATVRASLTDLLCLAGRLEDADTLFFQRRLVLTGDTELGLTARNLLDRLPFESLPLGLRIALNRCARFACAARAAHRAASAGSSHPESTA